MNFQQEKIIISKFLELPSAPTVLEKMRHALDEEKLKREHFYADIDDDIKAEFINGEIIIHSPVKIEHTDAVGNIYTLLRFFVQKNDLGYVGYEKMLTSFTRNDYEPDVVFFDKTKAKKFKKGMWKFPVPDLVVEVLSKSTENRDRGIKFEDYNAHGVREYWIVDADKETIEQYILKNKKFDLALKAKKGQLESKVVKGFKAEISSFFDSVKCYAEIERIMK